MTGSRDNEVCIVSILESNIGAVEGNTTSESMMMYTPQQCTLTDVRPPGPIVTMA